MGSFVRPISFAQSYFLPEARFAYNFKPTDDAAGISGEAVAGASEDVVSAFAATGTAHASAKTASIFKHTSSFSIFKDIGLALLDFLKGTDVVEQGRAYLIPVENASLPVLRGIALLDGDLSPTPWRPTRPAIDTMSLQILSGGMDPPAMCGACTHDDAQCIVIKHNKSEKII